VFYQSDWVRADQGGILMSTVKLGDKVREGQVLGSVIDPVSNTGSAILAPFNGRILGMAVNQVVQTGFATHHIGVETAAEKVQEEAIEQDLSATELAPSGNCVANGSNTASTVADC
jgi:predicted deacylase